MSVDEEVICYNNNGYPSQLTLYKSYKILNIIGYYIYIINDNGIIVGYTKNRFLRKQEWRDKQLNKLII